MLRLSQIQTEAFYCSNVIDHYKYIEGYCLCDILHDVILHVKFFKSNPFRYEFKLSLRPDILDPAVTPQFMPLSPPLNLLFRLSHCKESSQCFTGKYLERRDALDVKKDFLKVNLTKFHLVNLLRFQN